MRERRVAVSSSPAAPRSRTGSSLIWQEDDGAPQYGRSRTGSSLLWQVEEARRAAAMEAEMAAKEAELEAALNSKEERISEAVASMELSPAQADLVERLTGQPRAPT